MKILYRLLTSQDEEITKLRDKLDKWGYSYPEHSGAIFEVTFSAEESFADELRNYARKEDIYVQSWLEYEDEELKNAEWLVAQVGEFQYPQPEGDFGYLNTTYDLTDYCSLCGQGAIQKAPFQLESDFKQKKLDFLGLYWLVDVFVRPRVKEVFTRENITGIEYWDVLSHKTGEPIYNLFQLNLEVLQEESLATEDLFPVTCKPKNEEYKFNKQGKSDRVRGVPYCGRIKYHFPVDQPVRFKKEAFNEAPDLVKSREYFGSGRGALRFIFARRRVVDIVETYQLRGITFRQPIELV